MGTSSLTPNLDIRSLAQPQLLLKLGRRRLRDLQSRGPRNPLRRYPPDTTWFAPDWNPGLQFSPERFPHPEKKMAALL
jgi:hypothetical protein